MGSEALKCKCGVCVHTPVPQTQLRRPTCCLGSRQSIVEAWKTRLSQSSYSWDHQLLRLWLQPCPSDFPGLLTATYRRTHNTSFLCGFYTSFSLPKVVKRRVNALKNLQVKCTQIEAKFYEEVHELERKYATLYQPLFEKVGLLKHLPAGRPS